MHLSDLSETSGTQLKFQFCQTKFASNWQNCAQVGIRLELALWIRLLVWWRSHTHTHSYTHIHFAHLTRTHFLIQFLNYIPHVVYAH